MTESKTALITGANKGIGFEIAAGLGALGWTVVVAARDDERREAAVGKLCAAGADAFGVRLDVLDDAGVTAAAQLVEQRLGRLDVLVNNAGVTGGMPQDPTTVDLAAVRVAVETNVIARQTTSDDILVTGPLAVAYTPSKTFLNAVTVQYAKELRGTGILINAACPGFVATDLNDFRGLRTPGEGAAIAIRLATLPDDGPTGGFFEDAGEIPW